VPGVGKIKASLVDAANACCFISAADLGLTGTEMSDAIEQDAALMEKLQNIRLAASVAMGITPNLEEAAKKKAVPFVGFVSAPQDAPSLSGDPTRAADVDLTGRMLSNGQPHRALPLTCSLCMAVAARIDGSIVQQAARANADVAAPIRIAMPSGILTVASTVGKKDGKWHAEQGAFYRTQRRLFDGYVYGRASRVPGLVAKAA
jgi:2-methylaconitate cis-trans-isomerase PrpF